MRIIVGAFVTLDGVMQSPGGPTEDTSGNFTHGGWLPPHFDDTVGEAMGELMGQPFDLLLGRKSYDILGAYWPRQKGDPTAEKFDRITKYLASRNPNVDAHWQNTHVLGPDVVASLREIKQGDGPALITQGSADLLQTLFRSDLVDEITMLIFPVILGYGKRMFAEGISPAGLSLISSKVSPSGVTINRYARAAKIQTGTVGGVDAP